MYINLPTPSSQGSLYNMGFQVVPGAAKGSGPVSTVFNRAEIMRRENRDSAVSFVADETPRSYRKDNHEHAGSW
jgi:hypothetical protein